MESTYNNLFETTNELFVKYKNNTDVVNMLHNHIKNEIPIIIKIFEEKKQEERELMIEINNYISNFLNNGKVSYYYIINTDTYICYLGKNYEIIRKSDMIFKIFKGLPKKWHRLKKLPEYKNYIKNEIMKNIRKNDILYHTLPESNTIQNIIKFLSPLFFKTKEEAKYFLTVIGDNIFKKNYDLIYYVSTYCKQFLYYINNQYEEYFNNSGIISNLRYRYTGATYDKSRILKFEKMVNNESLWKTFFQHNFFNFIVISCHYSNRYKCADQYIRKQNIDGRERILYLENNTQDKIVNDFKKQMLIKDDSNKLNTTDMYFLWKMFLDMNSLPNIIYKNDFLKVLKPIDYICNSNYLKPARYFTSFWDNHVKIDKEMEDELEISELNELYSIWLNQSFNIKNKAEENELKQLIIYFYPYTEFEEDNILNISCDLWIKGIDISLAINNKFNLENIQKDLSMLDSYKLYCSFCCNKNSINIVSKKYFEKYIDKVIPRQYIKDNIISKEYWN